MKKALIALLAVAALMVACKPEVVKVSRIQLSQTEASIVVGESLTLKTIISPSDAENQQLAWTSSNEAVATVADGKITAVKEGTATIKAASTDGSNVTAECAVTVVKKAIPVTSIALDESEMSLKPGETLQLTAVVSPKDATVQAVNWRSSDSSVASVDQNGLVTALAGGSANITASATDGSNVASDPCVITVLEAKPMFAKYKNIRLYQGQNLSNETTVWVYYGEETDWANREIIYAPNATCKSSNEGVITVAKVSEDEDEDFSVNVTSVGIGEAKIIITDINGTTLEIPVKVDPIPEMTEDWLPGISLVSTKQLYDESTGKGWFAQGDRSLDFGFAPGTECFHVKNHASGASETTGTNYLVAQCKFDKVDISAIPNPALYIRFYCSNVAALNLNGANSQIELASKGMDNQELCWTGGTVFKNWYPEIDQTDNAAIKKLFKLQDGWNVIVLPLDNYAQGDLPGSFNPFDPKKVCYFRWYSDPYNTDLSKFPDLDIAIDQLRIVDWTEYDAVDCKELWMQSGTANNWGAYGWKDELDGHHGVFGGVNEYMGATYTHIWLRARYDAFKARRYSVPANIDVSELKLVWHIWVDDPDFFNKVTTTVEICSGPSTNDTKNFKWTHNHPGMPHDVNYQHGWNTIEEELSTGIGEGTPADIRDMYTFRIVFTNNYASGEQPNPGRNTYYIDDIRLVKK